jgi:hypothetical protein
MKKKEITKNPIVEEIIDVIENTELLDEYFLVTWEESSDETHFSLIPMNHFDAIIKIKDQIFLRKISSKEIIKLVDSVLTKSILNICVQTYCTIDWPFGKYNIKKIINIPELGW